ncbi:MAG: GNAT family N-acetyltransferase [Alphaproteobacteria bacterium]
MSVVVRPVRADERAAFLGPALRSWLDAYVGHLPQDEIDAAPAMLERAWEKRADAFRVAVLDGAIAGFYSLGAAGDPETVNYLWHLYVDPLAQRRGVGRALNAAALAEIAARGAAKAWLDVLEPNAKARAFYAALGWRESGRERTERYDLIIMERDLT